MIQILPLREKEILNQLNEKEGTKAALAFCLYEGKEISGYVLYQIEDTKVQFIAVNALDESAVDGLVRAVLASVYDRGIDRAIFAASFHLDIVRKLNILGEGEKEIISIKDILYNCRNCKKANNCAESSCKI